MEIRIDLTDVLFILFDFYDVRNGLDVMKGAIKYKVLLVILTTHTCQWVNISIKA